MTDASHPSYGSFGAVRVGDMSGGYGMKSERTRGYAVDDGGNDDNGSQDDHSIMSAWYQPPRHVAESTQSTQNASLSSASDADLGPLATALALTARPEGESRRASLSLPASAGAVASRVRDSFTPSDSLPPTREAARSKGLGSSSASYQVLASYHHTQH